MPQCTLRWNGGAATAQSVPEDAARRECVLPLAVVHAHLVFGVRSVLVVLPLPCDRRLSVELE